MKVVEHTITSNQNLTAGTPGRVKTGGRKAGTPNNATIRTREAFALLMDSAIPQLEQWLQEVYEKDGPKAALHIILEIAEYQLPKLARMEVTGTDGGPVRIVAAREDQAL